MLNRTRPYEFIDEHLKFVVGTRLAELTTSSQNCVEFPAFFTKAHRSYIHNLAKTKGLNATTYQKEGLKYVKVYKTSCSNFAEEAPTFELEQESRKVIFNYLKNTPPGYKEKYEVQKSVPKATQLTKPKVPIYRFCVWTVNSTMPSVPPKNQNKFGEVARQKLPIYKYRDTIIDIVDKFQVTIITSDSMGQRSTEIPQYLLDVLSERKLHCRIICAQTHKISAVHNSDLVSSQRGERLGVTIGYQIRLESMSSTSTNLLYTTSSFFLRCLMGSTTRDTFSGLTHIIIEDIAEREAYCDMLLFEIRQAMQSYPDIKIILLCSSNDVRILKTYFKQAFVLEMKLSLCDVSTYHLDDVLQLTQNLMEETLHPNGKSNGINQQKKETIDRVLGQCMELGNDESFNYFLYLLETGKIEINSQHSLTKITVGMAAARHDQLKYLIIFINLGGNIFYIDTSNKSALVWAQESKSESCATFLHDKVFIEVSQNLSRSNLHAEILRRGYSKSGLEWTEIDQLLVLNVLKYIDRSDSNGTVLVFLPSYRDVIKQEFILKQHIEQENMSQNIKIHLLHHNIEIAEYKALVQPTPPNYRKIVLSTDLAESTIALLDVKFVIDCGRKLAKVHHNYHPKQEQTLFWITQDCAATRKIFAANDSNGICFRLYSNKQFDAFQKYKTPELLKAPLSKICLYAKLLAPYITIKEYFLRIIQSPSCEVIEQTSQLLQEIGAFDEAESITPLGIRLVDIPVDVQLGKALIFAIVLQCLDPVLTIVSALAYQDPWLLQNQIGQTQQFVVRKTVCEGTYSDHLILLRIFQKWQDDRAGMNEKLLDEPNYVLNGELETISAIRSQIIGTLRAAGLIQSNGIMSMHFINVHANNWALVKACFTAGMYPNICRIDRNKSDIKAKNLTTVNGHETSVFCNNEIKSYQTNWVLYQEIGSTSSTSIKCNSIITPITIALFAGNIALPKDELISLDTVDSDSESESYEPEFKTKSTRYNVDEWLSFILNTDDAYLLYGLRQRFFSLLIDVIRMSEEPDKFRKTKNQLHAKFGVLEPIAHVLKLEERHYNLPDPQKVGERPKALSVKYAKNHDKFTTLKNNMLDLMSLQTSTTTLHSNTENLSEKSFFVLKVASKQQVSDYFQGRPWMGSVSAWRQVIEKYRKFPATNVVVFLLLSDCNNFCSTAHVCCDSGQYFLNEIAAKDVSLIELKSIYYTNEEYFYGCYDGEELKPMIGKQFFELFL